jgi:hypothetical protein
MEMAKGNSDFIREGDPKDLFRLGKKYIEGAQIGKNYAEIKKQLIVVLQLIFEDYKKEGVIYTLSKYESPIVSRTYLRKLADLGIIRRLTASKKNMQYEWNSGGEPDFLELANLVLVGDKTKTEIKDSLPSKNYSLDLTKVTILLAKSGISEDKIPELAQEIMKIFYFED